MEIAPNLYAIDFGGRVWAYLYRTAGSFTLIDTGIAGRAPIVLAELERASASPGDIKRIVATHCHRDHTGNLAELRRLTGATTFAGRLDAPFIRGDTPVPAPQLTDPERAIVETAAGGIPDAPPASVDTELDDGDEIDLGSAVARVIHLPGHTPGSIAVHMPAARLLFSGDAVASLEDGRLIVGPFNVDTAQARASLRNSKVSRWTSSVSATADRSHGTRGECSRRSSSALRTHNDSPKATPRPRHFRASALACPCTHSRRRSEMAVKPVPDGYHSVTPYLVVNGAGKLIDFMKDVFGAEETFRMGADTIMHAEVRLGDSVIMLGDANPEHPARPAMLHIYLPDADAAYRKAVDAGARSIREPADQFYGDRSAGVVDEFGNEWWVATHIEDVPPEEMERRAAAAAQAAQAGSTSA